MYLHYSMCYARKNTIVYEFHSYFEHKCPPPPNMEVLKKCCKSFHVSSSISFCNNLKKRQIQTNETKKNLLIALFLTPYIFLVNICFRTEKKSYPQKKIISLCEIKTTEKK
jgi:hypothetical protein